MNIMQVVGEGKLDGYQCGADGPLPPYWEMHDLGSRVIPVMIKGPDTIPTKRIRLYLMDTEEIHEGQIGFYKRWSDKDKWNMEDL